MKIWDKIKNKLKNKNLPPPIPYSARSEISAEEVFDLKSLKVPGTMASHSGYYVFCKDPRSKDDKEFLYYKKVISFEPTLESANRMINLMNSKYAIIAIKYNFKTKMVENCHPGEAEYYKEQIVQFEQMTSSAAVLSELSRISKKTENT